MKNSTKIFLALGAVVAISISALSWVAAVRLVAPPAQPEKAVGTGFNSYQTYTSGAVSVSGATSTTVLPVNTNRTYARVQNLGSAPVYCALSGSAVTTSTASFVLDSFGAASSTANGAYPIPQNYAGKVNCIGNGATSTVQWTDNQ